MGIIWSLEKDYRRKYGGGEGGVFPRKYNLMYWTSPGYDCDANQAICKVCSINVFTASVAKRDLRQIARIRVSNR